jgi:hypothetical protein
MQFRIRHTPGLFTKTINKLVMLARSLGVTTVSVSTPGAGIITEEGLFFITEDNIYIVQE